MILLWILVESCDDSTQKVPMRHDLKVTIEKVSLCLNDVAESRIVSTHAVSELLRLYARVCVVSGKIMETLDKLPSAHMWYSQGVKLATLLADTDPALQHKKS